MHFCFKYSFACYDIDFFEKHHDVLCVVRH